MPAPALIRGIRIAGASDGRMVQTNSFIFLRIIYQRFMIAYEENCYLIFNFMTKLTANSNGIYL